MTEDYFTHLSYEEKRILKHKETEPPFSGRYNDHFEAGLFLCRACESPLYESNTKFNSGCGWPSFDDVIEGAVDQLTDHSGDKIRIEIRCSKCQGHLGHIFHGEKLTIKDTRHCVNSLSIRFQPYSQFKKATFGAGCFWSIEKIFKEVEGIYLTSTGYMGGKIKAPTYKIVCSGKTNYAEVVNLYFNPLKVSFIELLDIFWQNHNPTTLNKQGVDEGIQYRSVIFYHSKSQEVSANQSIKKEQTNWKEKIVTEVTEASKFYRAEEYHQNYLNKNNLQICGL